MITKKVNQIQTHNYKNIKLDEPLELNELNVLIGPNGSGKSNLIDLFRFLKQCVTEIDSTRGITSFEGAVQALGNTRILDGTIQTPATVELKIEFEKDDESIYNKSLGDSMLSLGLYVQNEQWGVIVNKEMLEVAQLNYTQSNTSTYYNFHNPIRGEGRYLGSEGSQASGIRFASMTNVPTNELMLTAIEKQFDVPNKLIEHFIQKELRLSILSTMKEWQFYNANHMNHSCKLKQNARVYRGYQVCDGRSQ